MRRCSLEGNNNFLGGGDDVIDFSSVMLDNRGGVENFFEGFDKFATGLTYSLKMLEKQFAKQSYFSSRPFIIDREINTTGTWHIISTNLSVKICHILLQMT